MTAARKLHRCGLTHAFGYCCRYQWFGPGDACDVLIPGLTDCKESALRNDSQSPTPAHDEDITVSLDAIELYARRLEDRYEERTATLTAVGGILGQVERIRRLIGEVV